MDTVRRIAPTKECIVLILADNMTAASGGSALVWLLIGGAGLVLWLVGGRVIRLLCMLWGLLAGGFGGLLVAENLLQQGEGVYLLPLTLGGALLGAVLAGWLFRIWVALMGAAVLAVLAAGLIWLYLGVAPPAQENQEGHEAAATGISLTSALQSSAVAQAQLAATDEPVSVDQPSEDRWMDQGRQVIDQVLSHSQLALRQLSATGQHLREQFEPWWQAQDTRTRRLLYLALIIGAVVGLVLGLTSPESSALLQSALLGTVLMLLAGSQLALIMGEPWSAWAPQRPRSWLLLGTVLLLMGFFLQLLLRRRLSADGD